MPKFLGLFFIFITFFQPIYGRMNMSPQNALNKLIAGNKRFVGKDLTNPLRYSQVSEQLVDQQNPFAVILCCSDSRASPEIIFNQGLGDLFLIRVAGNVLGSLGLESINYGVQILGAPLVVVLGHQNCGAVKTVMEGKGRELIPNIFMHIAPDVENANSLTDGIKSNVRDVVNELSLYFKESISKGKLIIVGGYYNLDTGKVDFFDEKTAKK